MRSRIATLVTALSLLGGLAGLAPAVQAAAPPHHPTPVAAESKSCGGSFTRATIGGQVKCLRRGQFCAHGAERTYRGYGFHCRKRDAGGRYHLT